MHQLSTTTLRVASAVSMTFLCAELFCASSGALTAIAPSGFQETFFTTADGLAHDSVWAIHQDRYGFLWLGTEAGLDRFDGYDFTHFGHDSQAAGSLGPGAVVALHEDRFGDLWVGTRQSGLYRFRDDDESFEPFRHDPADPTSLSHDSVLVLGEDYNGALWVGTAAGLNRFERQSGTFTRFSHHPGDPGSLRGERVLALHEDRAGRLWIGTDQGLELYNRRANTFLFFGHDETISRSFGSGPVRAITEAPEGRLWVAVGNGISLFDPRSETALRQPLDATVLALHSAPDGQLWAGTENAGPMLFEPARTTPVSGGGSATIRDFFEDRSGLLWLATDNGAARLVPVGASGLPPPVVITALELREHPSSRRLPIFSRDKIVLPHAAEDFTLEFAALDYLDPRQNAYAFRLEGFDRDWIEVDATERRARYTHLPAGRYVFRVKAAGATGAWNEAGTALEVVIEPAPWKSPWAMGLYGLLAVIGAGALVRAHSGKVRDQQEVNDRLREVDQIKDDLLAKMRLVVKESTAQLHERENLIAELEAKNAELERFTYTVSHDLKSPLVTIKGFLGFVQKDAAAGDVERLQADIGRINEAAEKMQILLDELLELSRVGRVIHPPEEVSVSELARTAAALVEGAIAESGVAVEIADDLPAVEVDRARMVEVFQNLIDNAVKFTRRAAEAAEATGNGHQPRIEIGRRRTANDEDIYYVRDNGIGIEPRYHDKVFGLFERLNPEMDGTGIGLALVKRIIELHDGRIWVESQGHGHGTTFCFTLPPRPRPPREADP